MLNVISMALKSQFLPQNCKNRPGAEGSAPYVTRLISNGLFSTGPKLDNFCAKNIPFGSRPFSLSKILVDFLVAFTPANKFFKRLYGPHANELINAAGPRNFFFYHGFADLLRHILCPNLQFRTPLSILT